MIDWQKEAEMRREDLLRDLDGLLRIASVKDLETATAKQPMGREIGEALDYMLKLTEEEEKMAANMASSGIFDATVKNKAPRQAGACALSWVKQRFEPNGELSTQSAGQAYENKDYPSRAFFDSTITMQSGNVYSMTVCWPSMDVVQVTVLDQK